MGEARNQFTFYKSYLDALVKLNMNSPRKRISKLARMGYDVRKVWETRTNDSGETVRYLRYYISKVGGGQDGT